MDYRYCELQVDGAIQLRLFSQPQPLCVVSHIGYEVPYQLQVPPPPDELLDELLELELDELLEEELLELEELEELDELVDPPVETTP